MIIFSKHLIISDVKCYRTVVIILFTACFFRYRNNRVFPDRGNILDFYTQESHPLIWPELLLHVALTGTLPGSTSHLGKESELGPVVVLEERGKWCYDVKETPVFSRPVHHFGPN